MPLYLWLIGDSPLRLWGLDSRQRLQRLLPDAELVEDPTGLPDSARVLLVHGDCFNCRPSGAPCRSPP